MFPMEKQNTDSNLDQHSVKLNEKEINQRELKTLTVKEMSDPTALQKENKGDPRKFVEFRKDTEDYVRNEHSTLTAKQYKMFVDQNNMKSEKEDMENDSSTVGKNDLLFKLLSGKCFLFN